MLPVASRSGLAKRSPGLLAIASSYRPSGLCKAHFSCFSRIQASANEDHDFEPFNPFVNSGQAPRGRKDETRPFKSSPGPEPTISGHFDAARHAREVQARLAMAREMSKANRKRQRRTTPDPTAPFEPSLTDCGNEDVLNLEVRELLSRPRVGNGINGTTHEASQPTDSDDRPRFEELNVIIEELSSTAEGLARHPTRAHVYVVPFVLPGESAKIKVDRLSRELFSKADLIEVTKSSSLRDRTAPACKYFGQCSGCQFQMMPYEAQLKHKRTVVEHAYRNFSNLDAGQIPSIGETGASPLQYGYRTKLTPHFDGPRKGQKFSAIPPIGFTRKNFRQVMDIETCPIGTPILQEAFRTERAKVAANIDKYKRGATILLRETTSRTFSQSPPDDETKPQSCPSPLPPDSLSPLPNPESIQIPIQSSPSGPCQTLTFTIPDHPTPITITDQKRYTTDNTTTTTEHIGSYTFTTRAGSFFQNNNSILSPFLTYVRSVTLPPNPASTSPSPLKYLLDAYCGSGLFALTLSPLFTSVLGIELDPHGVTSARLNASANNITNAGFIEADAAALFADVPFPAEQTVLVIDPPRKGCSVGFLRQLLRYAPARVVYVSCNVHSQARDVGCLVKGRVGEDWWREEDDGEGKGKKVLDMEVGEWRYEIEELRGWDFFPQTGHVEGLCVLRRVENEAWKGREG